MTPTPSFNELVWLHQNSYGKAITIPKKILRCAFAVLCIATPGTNWAIPIILPKINDITMRW